MILGHSLKVVALASINLIIAMVLAVAYLSHAGGGRTEALSEDNVTAFIRDISDITSGQRAAMGQYTVMVYFMDHVADDGAFRSNVRTRIPGMPERNVDMDKKAFVADTLQGMREKGKYDAVIEVEDIKIRNEERTATATTTRHEKGMLRTITAKDGKSGSVPVTATSNCKLTISLSNNHIIQLQESVCDTSIAPVGTP